MAASENPMTVPVLPVTRLIDGSSVELDRMDRHALGSRGSPRLLILPSKMPDLGRAEADDDVDRWIRSVARQQVGHQDSAGQIVLALSIAVTVGVGDRAFS
ncbi:MAG: hypothetical protein ACE5KX_00390 [Acidimicrobiia bacterium]